MAHNILTGPVTAGMGENIQVTTWEDLTPQEFFEECYDRCNYDDTFPSQDGDTYGRPGKGREVENVSRAWCIPGPDATSEMKGDVD